uniref:SIMPL domain-containing protein n=1 Tax=Eiseniibacteriota bacterium TaxID=2212470 RepID=A0A832ML13_UNCEI
MHNRSLLSALVLATAVVVAALAVGRGLERLRAADRSVSVKGVAERVVEADVALWPLRLVAAHDDLDAARRKIEADRRTVAAFLARHGIDTTASELQAFNVTDTRAQMYGGAPAANRYVIQVTVMVRTSDLDAVARASQAVPELVSAGVVLSSGGEFGSSGPTYLFTRLNDHKPEMLAEATASARKAAEEFARQSRARVGGIRRASQGIFEILPRDQAPGVFEGGQRQKTLRVVTTLEYALL